MNTSVSYQLKLFLQVWADNVKSLYKRNLELDIKKQLEIKKLKLEIEQLEYERAVLQWMVPDAFV